jgi:hypothetical protein
MEIPVINYYDLTKFANTQYLIMMAIETFFANNVFRSDLTRVFYASDQYAFRQRLNLLAKGGTDSIYELQLPFMSYFREGNWQIDTRAAVMNATAALEGFADASIANQKLRFLQVKTVFKCVAWFNSDADAQAGYEALLWIQQPAPKQFSFSSIDYLGSTFDIPIYLGVENLNFNPNMTEKDWLVKNRVFPITFDLQIKSVVLAQQPQSPESNIFNDNAPPVITKTVLLDFLSYKNQNSFTDQQHIDFEVTGTFNNDPSLNGTLNVTNTTNTSITVAWSYNPAADTYYTSNVTLTLNGYDSVDVARNALTYTFNNLEPGSTYNIAIWFFANNGQITKYTVNAVTGTNTIVNLKGMVGYSL